MSQRRLSGPAACARHIALLICGALILVPFAWMVSLSLKPPDEIFSGSISLLPNHWYALENYTTALTAVPLARFILNGLIVCVCILALQLFVGVPAAYALAKLNFPGRDGLFAVVLIGLMVPHQVLALPLYVLCYEIGITDSYAALVLPFVVSPFGIFLFRQFFKSIPDDLVHAARLDGLSEVAIVWRIMVPMALPAVAAFSIYSLVAHWNDLFWPSIVIKSEAFMPPSLGVTEFRSAEAGADYGPLMACAVLVVLPLLIAFTSLQRWFMEGLTSSSLK